MRDLARESTSYKKRHLNSKPRLVGTIIIVLVIVSVIYFLSSQINVGGGNTTDSQTLHNAPVGLVPVKVDSSPVDTSGGVNLASNTITLRNVGAGGTATATRVYGNGSYSLSVNATLPDPKGDKYQVWLSDGENAFDGGFMNGNGSGQWTDVFRNDEKYSKFRQVWITREITSEDNKPEKHVMEGSF